MAGVDVPLQACEHFYIVTEPIAGLPRDLPVLRVPDDCAYYKEDAGKLLLGAFEPKAKPWALDGIPEDFCFDELPEDFDHFQPILEKAMRAHADPGRRRHPHVLQRPGELHARQSLSSRRGAGAAEFLLACGFNSIGIQSAGGAGMALAQWIDDGRAALRPLGRRHPPRCSRSRATAAICRTRVSETLGLLYADHLPYRQSETSRGVRALAAARAAAARGACFGEMAGWERANWFAPHGRGAGLPLFSWKRQNWFEASAAEHMAVRERSGCST